MLSLAQWRQIRSVDHLRLPIIPPLRIRAQDPNVQDLQVFDAEILAYHSANNNFDRASILGRMLYQLTTLLKTPSAQLPKRYAAALDTLRSNVKTDLNQICGPTFQVQRNQDILAAGNGAALAPKTVTVNVYYLHPMGAPPAVALIGLVDAAVNNHLLQAGHVYAGSHIQFARSNPAATPISQTPGPRCRQSSLRPE
jgi:hypothetical protein